jgi:hypothetical protein
MTDHVRRLYLAAGSLLAFFLAWAGIAAHPWSTPTTPNASQAQAVALYQQRLQRDAVLVRQLSALTAPTPSTPRVKVVTLPPLTTTRTS